MEEWATDVRRRKSNILGCACSLANTFSFCLDTLLFCRKVVLQLGVGMVKAGTFLLCETDTLLFFCSCFHWCVVDSFSRQSYYVFFETRSRGSREGWWWMGREALGMK